MFVEERFHLPREFVAELRARPVPWGFGAFSEFIYYRTYSRATEAGQERWADTIIRVIEGAMSIRKDWYRKMGLRWNDSYWQFLAQEMTTAAFEMKFLPPGRGLWVMGTDYIFERGSMALNNCGFVDVTDDLASSAAWAMDALMCGVGVGFSTQNASFGKPHRPYEGGQVHYEIPDTREGWVESVRLLIESYFVEGGTLHFDYSKIRPAGSPLRGFGGLASGPGPLKELHERLRDYLDTAAMGAFNRTRLIADCLNAIGACVVSGNVRRSAEIATGSVYDQTFLNLKNYQMNPSRAEIGWMSNNSVVLSQSPEFELLPEISERVRDNGEPGVINLINIQKYARYNKKKPDLAVGMNPCGEIPLESRELCNLVEVFPTRCADLNETWRMMELATLYASTVSLLPSHDAGTNEVVARNRRIGVSVSGVADWVDSAGLSHVTMALREGYENHVEPTNIRLAKEAGVPPSVRLTTVKPSGTISLLAGVSPGMHYPYSRYAIRRVRVAANNPLVETLKASGLEGEPDVASANTLVFSFPLESGHGKTRAADEVSVWEQASLDAMLQREWADNSVSCTLYFGKREADQVERVLAAFAPMTKAMSLLPHQEEKDASEQYAQLPYESITREKYRELKAASKEIDWSALSGSDGADPRFCNNDVCEI